MYSVLLSLMLTSPAENPQVPQVTVQGAGCVGKRTVPVGPPEYFAVPQKKGYGCQAYTAYVARQVQLYQVEKAAVGGCYGGRVFAPIRNAVARHNERVADRSAARAVRHDERVNRVHTVSAVPVAVVAAPPPAAYFKAAEPVVILGTAPVRRTPVRNVLCPNGRCPVN